MTTQFQRATANRAISAGLTMLSDSKKLWSLFAQYVLQPFTHVFSEVKKKLTQTTFIKRLTSYRLPDRCEIRLTTLALKTISITIYEDSPNCKPGFTILVKPAESHTANGQPQGSGFFDAALPYFAFSEG